MKQQKYRTADDKFHHTVIPLQKIVLLDELGMHAEEQPAKAVTAEQEAAAQSADRVGEEFEGREDEEVEVGHAEEGTQAEDGHAVD